MLTSSDTHMPKRRKIGLACDHCRHKKTRCDGLRPNCSTCSELGVLCNYESPASPQPRKPTYAQLAQRVKSLEEQLAASESSGTDATLATIDASRTEDEPSVDAIATNAFNETPQKDIGYFGPTSNHALFRIISSAFMERLPLMRQSASQQTKDLSLGMVEDVPVSDTKTSFATSTPLPTTHPCLKTDGVFPGSEELHEHVSNFFTTFGDLIPYVSETSFLGESLATLSSRWRGHKNDKALLSIICAHASLLRDSKEAELFYAYTLRLLEGLTLRGASVELVQTLLLLCLFQQNTRRSIASWTYHALAVKAAFQLGLHSPEFYVGESSWTGEMLKQVWWGVINEDRSLSTALGRPCLISSEYVHLEPLLADNMMTSIGPAERSRASLYNTHVTLLNEIKATVVRSLYDSNTGRVVQTSLHETVVRRLECTITLARWQESHAIVIPRLHCDEIEQWLETSYQRHRFRLLLCLQHNSTSLLLDGPLINRVISDAGSQADVPASCAPEVAIAIEQDFRTARDTSRLVHCMMRNSPQFIDENAIWWTCNYNTFTAALHLLGILLICCQSDVPDLTRSVDKFEVREALLLNLETLEMIERSSLMNRKGRECLRRFLQVLDTLVLYPAMETSGDTTLTLTQGGIGSGLDDIFAQYILEPADDFILQSSQLSFLDTDFSNVGFDWSSG